ncbi:MAG TPA: hypothetical protein VE861_10960 [Gemmatimonadaceae bacterium]|nr:hypothetical protein [Gemmatimonadaceae bacterium]
MLLLVSQPAIAQVVAGVPTGQVTARVVPETVTVGQPFQITLRAVPPAGRLAVPPPVPDTGGIIEPLDPANVTRRGDTLMVRYRLLAWQPGVLTVPLGPVLMRLGASELSVPVDARVVVSSVLPSDSASRIPKAPRELFPLAARWWEQWWKWVLGAVLGLAALYLLHRWRTRDRAIVVGKASPADVATAAFARLDARRLAAAGEGGRHVALSAEIVRQYLADIEPSLPLTLTTSELQAAIRHRTSMPLREIAQLFEIVDAVRFGGTRVDPASVQRASGLAREVVRAIERVRTGTEEQAA